jgi:phosphoglycerate dehydrogenase-like enzyme
MHNASKNLTILGASSSGLAVATLASYLGYTAILVSDFNPIEKIAHPLLEAFAQLSTVREDSKM